MTGGGAWLGFHVSAYNDKTTKWPWFMTFIGGGVFDNNSWPPLAGEADRGRSGQSSHAESAGDICLAYQRMVSLEAQPSCSIAISMCC